MYVDEKTDKCDHCGTVMVAGNMAHGEPGSDARFLNQDICFVCTERLKIGNCSDCASVHDNATLDREYRCRPCAAGKKV
jgi:hypothetical protein